MDKLVGRDVPTGKSGKHTMMALGTVRKGTAQIGSRVAFANVNLFDGDDIAKQDQLIKTHGLGPFNVCSLNFEEQKVGFKDQHNELIHVHVSKLVEANC